MGQSLQLWLQGLWRIARRLSARWELGCTPWHRLNHSMPIPLEFSSPPLAPLVRFTDRSAHIANLAAVGGGERAAKGALRCTAACRRPL